MIAVKILMGLHLMSLGVSIAMHGQEKTGKHNAFVNLVGIIIVWTLYYFAGMFNGFNL
jgi:uncharacterized membrane protein